ncbi:MAG: DUF4230 domain-containing protein [Phycisphaerales bacterium]|nr:DUF4230 domain-containing protein [Phycisphaerales bacterium]
METLINILLLLLGVLVAAIAGLILWRMLTRKRGEPFVPEKSRVDAIAEHMRAVGKLIGLEVSAKEIATATKGLSWLPPLLLSQARVAMIFHFEKQYWIDLTRVQAADVEQVGETEFVLTLPPVEGSLRLIDVSPYDIQDGRVLGLLDVIQVNAPTQKRLMVRAQEQAAQLFQQNESRYHAEAVRSIERQLKAFLGLFDVRIRLEWPASQETPGAEAEANQTQASAGSLPEGR